MVLQHHAVPCGSVFKKGLRTFSLHFPSETTTEICWSWRYMALDRCVNEAKFLKVLKSILNWFRQPKPIDTIPYYIFFPALPGYLQKGLGWTSVPQQYLNKEPPPDQEISVCTPSTNWFISVRELTRAEQCEQLLSVSPSPCVTSYRPRFGETMGFLLNTLKGCTFCSNIWIISTCLWNLQHHDLTKCL